MLSTPPSPSNTPSPFLAQHGQLEPSAIDSAAFRPYWRRRAQLDRLLIDGCLTWSEWRIAIAYRNLRDKATASQIRASRPDGLGRSPGHRGLEPGEMQLAALSQLHRLRTRLAADDVRLVEAVVVLDLRWCQLARWLGCCPKTAKRLAVTALHRLGQAW